MSQTDKVKSQLVLPLLIALVGGLVGGYIAKNTDAPLLAQQPGQVAPSDPSAAPQVYADVSTDDDAFIGEEDAPVTVIEFSDYQCPFCKRFRDDTFDQIVSNYVDTGKVKFVYRDFPLSNHPQAQKAAEATECAREQDESKFWEMHDAIFANQGAIAVENLKQYALAMGLNGATFDTCLDSGKYAEETQKDFQDGAAAGISATPSFFVNGELVRGAKPYSAFVEAIDRALLKKGE